MSAVEKRRKQLVVSVLECHFCASERAEYYWCMVRTTIALHSEQ